MLNPFEVLPRTVFLLDPSIRIGNTIATKPLKAKVAIEYLRTGMFGEKFSDDGKFLGIVRISNTARPSRPLYVPEDMPPIEVLGVKFVQPAGAKATYLRTVTATM